MYTFFSTNVPDAFPSEIEGHDSLVLLCITPNAYVMSKRKVSVEDKIYAVNLYLEGKESQRRIADMFDVSLASVQQWIRNYESMGANAFTLKD